MTEPTQPEHAPSSNPLFEARPPATDPITYLTIVEANLTKENLPILHDVLQDAELTNNIGWDLVQTLLPLLPESQGCLQDVARLGNPREVILKVTEALRLLEWDVDDGSDEGEQVDGAAKEPEPSKSVEQFQILLSMLSILHPRVKTKYPSRFLSTSLQAVLSSYSEGDSARGDLTSAVLQFIKTTSGTKRPHLPSRMSSGAVKTLSTVEAKDTKPTESQAADDAKLTKRLLQAFITHVLEEYMTALSHADDVPGLCWSSRVQEKLYPERIIPNKPSYTDRFATEADMKDRTLVVGQIVALVRDLEIDFDELYATVIDNQPEPLGNPYGTEDPPDSAEDVPFSKTGALLLLTARHVSEKLYDLPSPSMPLPIFPNHAAILDNFVAIDSATGVGLQHESVLDAIMALALISLGEGLIGEPEDDGQFNSYLQITSLLSANSPSPAIRYHAHYLTTTVLRSHPLDVARLAFIRDTLEHCPYENLKGSAVSWLKGETLEANLSPPIPPAPRSTPIPFKTAGLSVPPPPQPEPSSTPASIFATPIALSTCAPFLFPDLSHDLTGSSLVESYEAFKPNISFYLATLNFYHLLLTAKVLHEALDIPGLHQNSDVGGSFLGPLKEASSRFGVALNEGGELYEAEGQEGSEHAKAELRLLDDVLKRVEAGVVALNAST